MEKEEKGYYLIIRGPLGIGKTTIAKKLAEILQEKYISFDKILEENKLDKADNKFIPEDYIKANKIVLPKTKTILNKGGVVVFDGCFYFKEQIEHLQRNLSFKGYIFTLKASIETCIERDSKRKPPHGVDATKAVYKKVVEFKYGKMIDITRSINEAIKEILIYGD